jgi:hypothetical protein
MADGVGLSVGATNLTAVAVGRAAVTRSAVVTLYPDRALEVGLPSENPRLNSDERGLVISGFVDRVGDPVGIVASDGTMHHGEVLLADALDAMLYEVTNGSVAADPIAVTYPAHWHPATVDALRSALAELPALRSTALIPDATAAVAALRDSPGLPASGLVALCDFGGSGTSISLVDAANGNQQRGATVRHTDLSGDLIDQAVLTQVLSGLSDAGSVDVTGTSAIGPLTRLRAQCRGAKERLSTTAATSLAADLPGHHSEVRLTRTELDDAIRQPVADFAGVLQETLNRNGVRAADLVAVATAGGGARIPLITTTLSEHLGAPVITTLQPELTSAIGGGLQAGRGVDVGTSPFVEAAPPNAAAAAVAATQMAPEVHPEAAAGSQALAWSEADDIPDIAPVTDPYDYHGPVATDAMGGPRPPMQFTEPPTGGYQATERRSVGLLVAGLILVLAAVAIAVWLVLRNNESTPSPSTTTTPTTAPTEAPGAPPPASEAPPPQTETITRGPDTITQGPETITQTQTQAPPPPPTSEAPPPPAPTSEAPPPAPEQPSSPSTPPRLVPTLPYETIPGLPFVPRPIQPPAPAP